MTTQYTFASHVSSTILRLGIAALASTVLAGCSSNDGPSTPSDTGSETSSGGGETRTGTGETRPGTGETSSGGGGTPASTCKTLTDCPVLTCVCYGVAGEQVRKCVNGACGATCADFDGCS